MNRKVMWCLMLALLTGCTASVGQNFDDTQLAKIHHDVTTKQELITWFGQPSSDTPFPQGQSILMWTWSQAKTGTTTEGRTLTIQLQNDKVKNYTVSKT